MSMDNDKTLPELSEVAREGHKLIIDWNSPRRVLVRLLHERLREPVTGRCPVGCLSLGSGPHTALVREYGPDVTIAEVIRAMPRLCGVPGIGRTSLREITHKLAEHGLFFAHDGCPRRYARVCRQCPIGCLMLSERTHAHLLVANVCTVGHLMVIAQGGVWPPGISERRVEEITARLKDAVPALV
jgi:hypothetical protein